MNRQNDFMVSTQPGYLNLPNDTKGKLTDYDFIFFDWDSSFDQLKKNYNVVLETLSYQSENIFRSIGEIQKVVKLPLTYFSNDALILLVPSTAEFPLYAGPLQRGKKYCISNNKKYKNYYLLK